MSIRRYTEADAAALFALLRTEGEEWSDYLGAEERYRRALRSGVTYVAPDGEALAGFVRCREDDGFGVYVYDLLVRRDCRGQGLGRALMDAVFADFSGQPVYVLSDVDVYYEKLGYARAGSVFAVSPSKGG